MAKFKKITTKYMCMLSAVVMFVSALFYPLESFSANMSSVGGSALYVNLQHNLQYDDILPDSFGNYLHERHIVTYSMLHPTDYLPTDYIEFDFLLGQYPLIATSEEVFAYQISCTASADSLSLEGVRNVFLSVGTYDEILEGDIETLGTFWNGPLVSCWYVNDFQRINLHVGFIARVIFWENESGSSLNSVRLLGSTYYTIVPYTVDDLTNEIYSVLQNIYSNNQQMLSKLEQIYTSVDTVETKLQSLVSIAEQIENNTDELEGLLQTCNSYLASIKTELEEQTTWLERIWNTLVDYFDTSNSQQDKVDDFANNSNQQSGSLDNLVNDMGQLEKPNVQDSVADIDSVIPSGFGFVFDFLGSVTNLGIVSDMLVLSVTMAFVAYVLFGKR